MATRRVVTALTALLVYAAAAWGEIASCFAFWAWTRLDKSPL
jgi:drug/metabolite transporter superfamily protein YnfA